MARLPAGSANRVAGSAASRSGGVFVAGKPSSQLHVILAVAPLFAHHRQRPACAEQRLADCSWSKVEKRGVACHAQTRILTDGWRGKPGFRLDRCIGHSRIIRGTYTVQSELGMEWTWKHRSGCGSRAVRPGVPRGTAIPTAPGSVPSPSRSAIEGFRFRD
jgi:hypothetical protein